MTKRILLASLFTLFMSQFAMAQIKVGYANPDYILSQLPEVQEISTEIQNFAAEKDAELQPRAESLQAEFDEYEEIAATLSESARKTREEELLQKNEEFEEFRRRVMEEVQLRTEALLEPLELKVNKAIEDVAKELGLDLVLRDKTSGGSDIIFFAADDQANITEKVLNKLK